MNTQNLIHQFVYPILAIIFFLPTWSSAQYISLKSIPVASGDQFLVHPSKNLGLGGVSIALDDPLLDPFINPAKGGQIQGVRIFGSPTFYSITDNNGAARTLPLGALFSSEKWFGGLSVAVQQLGGPEVENFFWRDVDMIASSSFSQTLLKDKNANNQYVSGLLGTKLSGSNISLAAEVSWAGLDAVDGVELLYANSQNIEQFGHMVDYRVGVFGELQGNRSFEALLLHNRFNMIHDVSYPFWRYDEETDTHTNGVEVKRNLDRTNTWGLHLGYVQPLPEKGWRMGGIFTVNRKTHPKIPNYEIMNIPRDPGNTWAYNFGAGISSTDGPATFGFDLIYEPIWSNTWADAAEYLVSQSGRLIPKGKKTVDNDFKFNNWLMRIGIGRQGKVIGFQFGLQLRWINYKLDQVNYVEEFNRTQEESWAEWTPCLGLSLNFPEFQIRYSGRLTTGTGRPGVAWDNWRFEDALASKDFIVAPSGALTLQEAKVFTHQITVSIPIRD